MAATKTLTGVPELCVLKSKGTKRQTFPICFSNLLIGQNLLLSEEKKKNSWQENSKGVANETLTCWCVLHLHTCTWKWHVRALGGLWCVAPTALSLRRGRCSHTIDQRGHRKWGSANITRQMKLRSFCSSLPSAYYNSWATILTGCASSACRLLLLLLVDTALGGGEGAMAGRKGRVEWDIWATNEAEFCVHLL